MKVINLFAGPGAGKSTIRAELFALLKRAEKRVEEVTEFAKDLTWERHESALSDQLYILANQNRRLDRLRGQVDIVVTDCPIILGLNYTTPDYLPGNFENLAYELWDTYDNLNFFIRRAKTYQQYGRSQNYWEATLLDDKISGTLKSRNIPFLDIRGDSSAAQTIFNTIYE